MYELPGREIGAGNLEQIIQIRIMKRLTTFIAGAAVAATLGGCQQPAVSGWKSFSGDKNIERRVDSVLSLMTLEEKVGQMAQYSCNWDVTGPVMTGDYETLLKQGLVGSLFNVYTVDGVRKMQEMALSESRLKIPVLFGRARRSYDFPDAGGGILLLGFGADA